MGHFWQDRFKSLLIEKDLYLLGCAAYIELNPVKAGRVKDPLEYPYSSFSFYASGSASSVLTPDPLYETFGDMEAVRRANYGEFVRGRLGCQRRSKIPPLWRVNFPPLPARLLCGGVVG